MTERLIINSEGNVVNHIIADDAFPADALDGLIILPSSVVGSIGGIYKDGVYTPPPESDDAD